MQLFGIAMCSWYGRVGLLTLARGGAREQGAPRAGRVEGGRVEDGASHPRSVVQWVGEVDGPVGGGHRGGCWKDVP